VGIFQAITPPAAFRKNEIQDKPGNKRLYERVQVADIHERRMGESLAFYQS
jgi:hypothetical protein